MSAQVPGHAPESWVPQTKMVQQHMDEAITLIAEDIRNARIGLGVSVKIAAASAKLEPCVYRAIEEGTLSADEMAWDNVWLAARRLGLSELRLSHDADYDFYRKLDISQRGPLTAFIDAVLWNFEKLREEDVWVNPSQVLALPARDEFDFDKVLRSRQLADKQFIELWIAAVFTLCCDRGRNYYVKLAKSDPPDAELLAIGDAGEVIQHGIEITRHEAHSPGLVELIRKKLRTKLPTGTIIVILVEQPEHNASPVLSTVMDQDNPHGQRICIVGLSQEPHHFKFVTYRDDETSDPEEKGWLEMDIDVRAARPGCRGYEGVVYSPKSSVVPPQLLFVKNLVLDR